MTLVDVARIVFALIAVLGMIGLAAMAAKKAGLVNRNGLGVARKRLRIIEALPLDQRRRAVILKCDDREHLLILNANSVTVVERDLPTSFNEAELHSHSQNGAPNPFADLLSRFVPSRDQQMSAAIESSSNTCDENGKAA